MIAVAYLACATYAQEPGLCLNGIEEAKLIVKEQERKRFAPFYPEALMRLAREYNKYGQTRMAEVTFRKALQICKTKNAHTSFGVKPSFLGSESSHAQTSSFLLSWADCVAYGRLSPKEIKSNSKWHFDATPLSIEDRHRADLTALEALQEIDKVPNLLSRADSYVRAAKLFKKTGNLKEENKCKKLLLSTCTACERKKGATEDELITAAQIFDELAYFIVPVLPPKEIPIASVPLSDPAVTGGYTEDAFRMSEKLRLRGTDLLDRLPRDNAYMIDAHRRLALWYMQFGRDDSANTQKGILSKLVGSKENGVLFPVSRACGISASGKPTGRLCGMG